MTALVIGLGGRLRSGKDVVADHLVAHHGFVKMGMSDVLHEAMMAIDPIIGAEEFKLTGQLVGQIWRYSGAIAEYGYVETKERFSEARRLLQNLGTEVGRNMIGENTWVNVTAKKIDDHLYADERVVVTGIRFPNELAMIHQFAGRTVWVDRPSLEETAASSHASENGVQAGDFDITLLNDASLEHLYGLADALVI